jgi:hypothetical protein
VQALAVHENQELTRPQLELAGPQGRTLGKPLERCLHGREASSILRDVRYLAVVWL